MRRAALLAALGLALGLGGCVSKNVRESALTVLTLQSGTVSALRDLRGSGPMRAYAVPPAEMLDVLEAAARKARALGGGPVQAVYVSRGRREIVAKERAGEHATKQAYDAPWRTAMLAVVHPVAGEPGRSEVEIHAVQRGPFHPGAVAWERDMPRWIDAVLAERAAVTLAPLPD